MSNSVQRVIRSHPSSDGDGVKIRRVALFNETVSDPFLMIDELRSDNPKDYIGGFPPHPHRGMETLTYLRQGGLEHRDHLGNRGMIHSGGAQWMSAGRGIIHSEMPSREANGLHGFQLWINLPAVNKMQAPDYRDVPATEIPVVQAGDVTVKAIAGSWSVNGETVEGALMNMAANAGILDVELPAGSNVAISAPAGHSLMAFVYDGELDLESAVAPKSLVVFATGENSDCTLTSSTGAHLLLLAGKPIKEKIVHYGPFVMNTVAEIEQTIDDYNRGRF
ncbi:pirin family protein [Parathalassolituus penaei]|mgnify:CR=1 FL=1|uniref:Pirin family protein n=1 Tax=Parathalassolituus penaei TaxID=2997323 RepID=A0A9X3IRQ4_9GAMM|nr:pirin family protein [Parathalassolituus penaei]MCY0964089.1 pirin family protein [Parathalassolituus penaei]